MTHGVVKLDCLVFSKSPSCVVCAAAMKLYFLFGQEFHQLAALFGGCVFGLFERVYMSLFQKRHTDPYTSKIDLPLQQ